MQSTRQNKISRLVQKELSDIFQKLGRDFLRGKLITVTKVRVTSDLALARAYLSVFPSEGKEEVLEQVRKIGGQIRGELGRRTGKQLRVIPDLEFFIDDSLDYIENIDRLLKE